MLSIADKQVPTTLFPDNTTQVWKLPPEWLQHGTSITVEWRFSIESDFLQLAQLKELLDYNSVNAILKIKYLPYGRQDKNVDNMTTFALVPFAKLLNSLKFQKIIIIDPHSNVALDLIHNSEAEYPSGFLYTVMKSCGTDLVCYPDKGARTKYSNIYSFPCSYIYGEKVRDQQTGRIVAYDLVGDCRNRNVMIVDDICDGGSTFILLTHKLLLAGAKEVDLFVTHGIFSNGTRPLFRAGINRVFTQDEQVGLR